MSVRALAVNIVNNVFKNKAYSNILLNNEIKKQDINSKDIGLLTEIVYGTIKYKLTIDYIINDLSRNRLSTIDDYILNVLRIAIYQMKYLDKVPDYAVVNEAVNLAKSKSISSSKFVNGILRSYLRSDKKENFKGKSIVDELSLKYSFEKWMVSLFLKDYGKEATEYILKGLNTVPKTTVRVNSLLGDYDEVYNQLQEANYDVYEGSVCPEAIVINRGRAIESNELFNKGYITVQDESAMLVGGVVDVNKDCVVFDLCSAPGGKATHLSELSEDKAKVYAFDIHEQKLELIKENAKRLKIKNIEVAKLDATAFNEDLVNKADRVLMDVPCSGLGIIRKKPEIKWFKTKEELKAIIEIQRKIMKNGARYLKSGGIMVYSTCTLNKEENEENVKWFLNNNKEFSLDKIYFGNVENIIYNENGSVTILPNMHMDGFFIAKFKKL
ncbi:16S rRNA (cytosine(967)-C(5))-methyltransferase RsmB [Desnuesiella massiliensis]|uniref:16S rRNA (cytosine(967)-C(5))-methyltransferase RsmB n=1 Tax=Desnuesiella massiliensis TaxID=1650662 RepID=UPI0006E3F57F|nr:16S rRNA (cytosine(967)-C(5))-methyltransferase RsmB [Desnuesiella massiliensis]